MKGPKRPQTTTEGGGRFARTEEAAPTRLYLARSDPAFTQLQPVREDAWPWRGGIPVTDPWEEPQLVPPRGELSGFLPVDCLAINTGVDGFFLSEFGREELSPLLARAGEMWPVRVLEHRYWWFNCLACVGALDRDKTDADWGTVEGNWGAFSWITSARRLEFKESELADAPAVFRLPEIPQGNLLAGEALVTVVNRLGLTGFRFDLAWSARGGGVVDPPGLGLSGVFDANAADLELKRAAAKAELFRRIHDEHRRADEV